MSGDTTLPKLLRRNASRLASRPALRERRRGIWQTWYWADYDRNVRAFARGLAAHGFRRGDRLAVLGDNRANLYAAQLAAQALGGVSVPAWPDADAAWLTHVLRQAAVTVAVAEDQDQLDKLMSIRHALPDLALIVHCVTGDTPPADQPFLRSFDEIVEAGQSAAADVAAEIEQGAPGDLALVCYTARPDGPPRGVMLSHANLIAAAESLAAAESFRPTDNCLSFLPMAWIGDALYSTTLGLLIGFACNCPEDPETARRDLREIGPDFVLAPPAVWDSLLAEIDTKGAQASPLKRGLFQRFRRFAAEGQNSAVSRLMGNALVYAPLRDQIGLRHARWAHAGGGDLPAGTVKLFRGLGVNLKQIYGPAELSGVGAIGRACPDVAFRISPEGEVLARCPGLFLGYLGDPGAMAAARDEDGWWRTGDLGHIEADGTLAITGRAGERMRLGDGQTFSPEQIETVLQHSPFVGAAVVPGGDRPWPAALIVIDLRAAGDWARGQGIAFTSAGELLAMPALRQAVRDDIGARQKEFPPAVRVRRFALLEAAAGGTEAGLSSSLRRHAVLTGNAALVDALFSERPAAGGPAIEDLDGAVKIAGEHAHA